MPLIIIIKMFLIKGKYIQVLKSTCTWLLVSRLIVTMLDQANFHRRIRSPLQGFSETKVFTALKYNRNLTAQLLQDFSAYTSSFCHWLDDDNETINLYWKSGFNILTGFKYKTFHSNYRKLGHSTNKNQSHFTNSNMLWIWPSSWLVRVYDF